MSGNDYQSTMRVQRHASLIEQAESLRGLRFSSGGSVWEFMVFATNVNTRNEILISGICTKSPSGKELNQFFQFNLEDVVLTPDSMKTLSRRLCRDAGDPNWGAE